LGREDEPLKGFDWRGGATRHTTGMIMWSEPFVLTLPDGEEVKIKTLNNLIFENPILSFRLPCFLWILKEHSIPIQLYLKMHLSSH
jgi:atlastin